MYGIYATLLDDRTEDDKAKMVNEQATRTGEPEREGSLKVHGHRQVSRPQSHPAQDFVMSTTYKAPEDEEASAVETASSISGGRGILRN
jgi:hypothetical protein